MGPRSASRKSGKRQGACRPRQRLCLLKDCEKPFRPTHPQARYCSPECREAARRWRNKRNRRKHRQKPKVRKKRQAQSQRYRCRCAERRLAAAALAAQAEAQAAEAQVTEAQASVPAAPESPDTPPAHAREGHPPASDRDFFRCDARGVKCGSYAPVTALASGFAALLAVRLCGGSSSGNGSGDGASGKLGSNDARDPAADHELIGCGFPPAYFRLLIALRGGRSGTTTGPSFPFSKSCIQESRR